MDLSPKIQALRRSRALRLVLGGSVVGLGAGGVAVGQQGAETPQPIELGKPTPTPVPLDLERGKVVVTPDPSLLLDNLDAAAATADTPGTVDSPATADTTAASPATPDTADTPEVRASARPAAADSPDGSPDSSRGS